jgi:hypothetical protein
VRLHLADGTAFDCAGSAVDAEHSAEIFERRGTVERIEVEIPLG